MRCFSMIRYSCKILVMNILCATGNEHKKAEFQKLLPGHKILTPGDLGIPFDVDETGSTFTENALLKASYLFRVTGKPVIADDSGLCVDALNGAPGIFSARYGNDVLPSDASFKERYMLLLTALTEAKQRSARFVCSLVYYFGTDSYYCIQETVEGMIAQEPAGENGFGYDPVFFVPSHGKTMAQLSDSEKNSISHRGKATHRLAVLLGSL